MTEPICEIDYSVDHEGTTRWYLNGHLHREGGPAVEYASGSKVWYLNGKVQRVDGPAIEYGDGNKEWYLHGKCHRIDGPAVEFTHPTKAHGWWLSGTQYSFENWKVEVRKYYDTEEDYLLMLLKL
jgi:hypothetical protein